jgi:hypothetical protein
MYAMRPVLVVVFVLTLVGCSGNARSASSSNQPIIPPSEVQSFEDQGRAHMEDGQTFAYNSNPPTSGPHSGRYAPWKVNNFEVPKEILVHNMEHGGVIVWYNCKTTRKTLTQSQCDQLYQQLEQTTQPLIDAGKEIVVSRYGNMNHIIALTAWGKLQTLEQFDLVEINKFIKNYERAFNPEGF